MKFVATIEMKIEVEAKNEEYAKELIGKEQPFVDMSGCGIYTGWYSLRTLEGVEIKDITEVK